MEAIKFNLDLVWNSGRQGTPNTSEWWTTAIVVDLHKPSRLLKLRNGGLANEIDCMQGGSEKKRPDISLVDPQLGILLLCRLHWFFSSILRK